MKLTLPGAVMLSAMLTILSESTKIEGRSESLNRISGVIWKNCMTIIKTITIIGMKEKRNPSAQADAYVDKLFFKKNFVVR